MFSWPNSVSSNGIQGNPAYFRNCQLNAPSPQQSPSALLYSPTFALFPPSSLTSEEEEARMGDISQESSGKRDDSKPARRQQQQQEQQQQDGHPCRKRKHESDTESISSEHHLLYDGGGGDTRDDDEDPFCNCEDCIAYLLEDLSSSSDDEEKKRADDRGDNNKPDGSSPSPSPHSRNYSGVDTHRLKPCKECGRGERLTTNKQRSNDELNQEEYFYSSRAASASNYEPVKKWLSKRSRSLSSFPTGGAATTDYGNRASSCSCCSFYCSQVFKESHNDKSGDYKRCDFQQQRRQAGRPDEESEIEDSEKEIMEQDLQQQQDKDTRHTSRALSPITREEMSTNSTISTENSQPAITTTTTTTPSFPTLFNLSSFMSSSNREPIRNPINQYIAGALEPLWDCIPTLLPSYQRAPSGIHEMLATTTTTTATTTTPFTSTAPVAYSAAPMETSSTPSFSPNNQEIEIPLKTSSSLTGATPLVTGADPKDSLGKGAEEEEDITMATPSNSETGFTVEEEEVEETEVEDDSLAAQIIQALRAALGIPDDVEVEEFEPVDEDEDNENAAEDEEEEGEEDNTGSGHVVTGAGLQDIKGCLALVDDVLLTYGRLSSASPKVGASIEGNASGIVIGCFLVSTSYITRGNGRLGYSLGFYLDDLELNSFVLQIQDGLLQVRGTRDEVDIYLRIEIGAPVRIQDVSVNHNKATNVIWVEVLF